MRAVCGTLSWFEVYIIKYRLRSNEHPEVQPAVHKTPNLKVKQRIS
jgi:hypothetical protein